MCFSANASFVSAAGLSLIGVYAVYSTWFISLWCFFAAALSGIPLLHFPPRNPARDAALRLVLRPGVARAYSQQAPQNLQ